MIHIVDGSEGRLGAGQYPEPTALLMPPSAARTSCVLAPIRNVEPFYGPGVCIVRTASRKPKGLPSFADGQDPLLHAWGRRSACWALDRIRGRRVQATLLDSPSRRTQAVTRTIDRLKSLTRVHVFDRRDAQRWAQAGLPEDMLELRRPDESDLRANIAGLAHRCGLPRPRDDLRALLGADADEFLVFPIAGAWSELDAHRFVFLLGMLRINGTPASAVVPASAWRLVGARMFGRQSRLGTRLCVIDGPMTPWLPACDAAFLDAPRPREALADFAPIGAARVLTMACDAMGVPVAIAPGSVLEHEPRKAPSVADELRPLLLIAEQHAKPRGNGAAVLTGTTA